MYQKTCIFNLILLGIPSSLVLFVKGRGVVGLYVGSIDKKLSSHCLGGQGGLIQFVKKGKFVTNKIMLNEVLKICEKWCIFYLIWVGFLSILILSVTLSRQNLLNLTKVICRQSLKEKIAQTLTIIKNKWEFQSPTCSDYKHHKHS